MSEDNEIEIRIKKSVVKWVRRIYVIAFNMYAWFWLVRLIFIRHSANFEDYLLWFFATVGMYFFVLDGKDIFLKDIHKVKDI
jgi:hypothetical protein